MKTIRRCTACDMDTMVFSKTVNKNFVDLNTPKVQKDLVDLYQCERCGLTEEFREV